MSRTPWMAAVLTAGLLVGSAGAAFAATPTPTPTPITTPVSGGGETALRGQATQDCKLISDLGPVVTDLQAIINGDAKTRGSVAWLNAEASRAKAAGRANLAAWLSSRATLRQEQGTVLNTRKQLLASGTSWCQAHGFGAES